MKLSPQSLWGYMIIEHLQNLSIQAMVLLLYSEPQGCAHTHLGISAESKNICRLLLYFQFQFSTENVRALRIE